MTASWPSNAKPENYALRVRFIARACKMSSAEFFRSIQYCSSRSFSWLYHHSLITTCQTDIVTNTNQKDKEDEKYVGKEEDWSEDSVSFLQFMEVEITKNNAEEGKSAG